jgi:hypothetical protein
MKRVPVASTSLNSIGYASNSRVLEVEFKSGAVYQYRDVPKKKFDAMMNALSIGAYFNSNIKDRYRFIKL